MDGYEAPFVERTYGFTFARLIKGDTAIPLCVTNYLRRRLIHGIVPLKWNKADKTWSAQTPDVSSAIYGFNDQFMAADLRSSKKLVQQYLNDVSAFYKVGNAKTPPANDVTESRKNLSDARALALCVDPATIEAKESIEVAPPIIKPLFKQIVKPGEKVQQDIIAIDPFDQDLKITVANLPKGATFDDKTRRITWTPTKDDLGLYVLQVTANYVKLPTTRPFIIGVSENARKLPKPPSSLEAKLTDNAVVLTWSAPPGDPPAQYLLYRDGVLWAAVPPDQTAYTDAELQQPGESTRYALSVISKNAAESQATDATPAIVHRPLK
jgi:hypothetical protein